MDLCMSIRLADEELDCGMSDLCGVSMRLCVSAVSLGFARRGTWLRQVFIGSCLIQLDCLVTYHWSDAILKLDLMQFGLLFNLMWRGSGRQKFVKQFLGFRCCFICQANVTRSARLMGACDWMDNMFKEFTWGCKWFVIINSKMLTLQNLFLISHQIVVVVLCHSSET